MNTTKHNFWLDVTMAAIVVLIWRPQTLSRPQKTSGDTENKSDSSDDVHKVR
jgi:hypothetical protein